MNQVTPLDQIRYYLVRSQEVSDEQLAHPGPLAPNVAEVLQREREHPQFAMNERKFIHLVDKCANRLSSEYQTKLAAVQKLDEIAKKYLESEKSYSGVERTLRKIAEFFKGHGFRTEGEWLVKLKNSLKSNIDNQNNIIGASTIYFRNYNNNIPSTIKFNELSGEMLLAITRKLYTDDKAMLRFWSLLDQNSKRKLLMEIFTNFDCVEILSKLNKECCLLLETNVLPIQADQLALPKDQAKKLINQRFILPVTQIDCYLMHITPWNTPLPLDRKGLSPDDIRFINILEKYLRQFSGRTLLRLNIILEGGIYARLLHLDKLNEDNKIRAQIQNLLELKTSRGFGSSRKLLRITCRFGPESDLNYNWDQLSDRGKDRLNECYPSELAYKFVNEIKREMREAFWSNLTESNKKLVIDEFYLQRNLDALEYLYTISAIQVDDRLAMLFIDASTNNPNFVNKWRDRDIYKKAIQKIQNK